VSGDPFHLAVVQFLNWSLEERPEDLEIVPFLAKDTVRKNDKRGAMTKIVIPDDWAKNIKGDPRLYDIYLALRVPQELFSEWNARKQASDTQRSLMEPEGSET